MFKDFFWQSIYGMQSFFVILVNAMCFHMSILLCRVNTLQWKWNEIESKIDGNGFTYDDDGNKNDDNNNNDNNNQITIIIMVITILIMIII